MNNPYYEIYKNDFVPCVFCGKCIMLYYAKQHLRTKRCLKIQELDENRNNSYIKFIKEINSIKSNIKLNIEPND